MTKIIVLFNLQSGVSRADYESWARGTDLPLVRSLRSVAGFDVLRTRGLLGSDAPPPYAYVEVIDVSDMDTFGQELGSASMEAVAREFHTFADNPVFILSESIEEE